jgi:hypothetical protein
LRACSLLCHRTLGHGSVTRDLEPRERAPRRFEANPEGVIVLSDRILMDDLAKIGAVACRHGGWSRELDPAEDLDAAKEFPGDPAAVSDACATRLPLPAWASLLSVYTR